MSDKMNYCIDCVSYFLDKEKNRYFCADKKTRIKDVPCEFFEQRCDDDIESPWHTGTPTEDGLYILAYRYGGGEKIHYDVLRWEGIWKDADMGWDAQKVEDLAWQKIEPYEEANG